MNSVRFSAAKVNIHTGYRDRNFSLGQSEQKRNWHDLTRIDALLKQNSSYRTQLDKLDERVQVDFYPHALHVSGGDFVSEHWVPTQLAEVSVLPDPHSDTRENNQTIRVERPFNKFLPLALFDGRQFLTNFLNDVVTAAQVMDASIRSKRSAY